jgi:uncharacterized membrane protein YoaK (UPF0700 family)
MVAPSPTADALDPGKDRDAPYTPLLFVLTIVTGLVDAVSYLALGHVFVANMTGNVVFLGFAVAGAPDFSIPASLLAIAGFLVGALAGGRLTSRIGQNRSRFVATTMLVKLALVGAAFVVVMAMADGTAVRDALIVLLSLAMGLQNAAARHVAVPDLTTTVLTLTLTGLAADSKLAGGSNPRVGRRLLATGAMFLGAVVGALLVLRVGVGAVLLLALTLLSVNAIAACRLGSRAPA